jgi:hypothetical protein
MFGHLFAFTDARAVQSRAEITKIMCQAPSANPSPSFSGYTRAVAIRKTKTSTQSKKNRMQKTSALAKSIALPNRSRKNARIVSVAQLFPKMRINPFLEMTSPRRFGAHTHGIGTNLSAAEMTLRPFTAEDFEDLGILPMSALIYAASPTPHTSRVRTRPNRPPTQLKTRSRSSTVARGVVSSAGAMNTSLHLRSESGVLSKGRLCIEIDYADAG